MPLRRGTGTPVMAGLDLDFTMIDGRGYPVPCTVTCRAIDGLAPPNAPTPIDRIDMFSSWQDKIEAIAAQKFHAGNFEAGRVVVRRADISHAGLRSAPGLDNHRRYGDERSADARD